MQSESAFTQSIAEAARTLNKPRSLDQTLQTIVEHDAFGYLVRASSHANIKLRDVAQELVDERNSP